MTKTQSGPAATPQPDHLANRTPARFDYPQLAPQGMTETQQALCTAATLYIRMATSEDVTMAGPLCDHSRVVLHSLIAHYAPELAREAGYVVRVWADNGYLDILAAVEYARTERAHEAREELFERGRTLLAACQRQRVSPASREAMRVYLLENDVNVIELVEWCNALACPECKTFDMEEHFDGCSRY